MVAPDNPLIAKVTLVFDRDTRKFVNTFHVSRATAWDMTAMSTLAVLFRDWWNTNYKTQASNAVSLSKVEVRKYDPTNPLALDLPVSPTIPGSNATVPDTGSTTMTMSWRTGLAGRKYRGRTYGVGLSEGDANNDDTVPSPRVVGYASAATALTSNLIAAGLSLAIFHRIDDTFTNVISVVIENLIDNMRSRLASRGA